MPHELVVIRLAERLHKLPSEVLSEEPEWFDRMLYVMRLDGEKRNLEERRELLKSK